MNNAFSRTGLKCASLLAGGVLMAAALFAAPENSITITLPHPVTTGSVTLPAGTYVMSTFEMGGQDIFVVRGQHTAPVMVRAMRIYGNDLGKTEATLSKDGNTWHFNRLTLADGEAFQFSNNE